MCEAVWKHGSINAQIRGEEPNDYYSQNCHYLGSRTCFDSHHQRATRENIQGMDGSQTAQAMVRSLALYGSHSGNGCLAWRFEPLVMRGSNGTESANRGVYLEIVKNERLVFTDAYSKAWAPSDKPFMTVVLSFEQEGGNTKYTARVLHWTVADREAHERMGFHQGWGQSTDQLAALVAKL